MTGLEVFESMLRSVNLKLASVCVCCGVTACLCVCRSQRSLLSAVQVVVQAVQDDVPKGLQKILDVLQAAILETTLTA